MHLSEHACKQAQARGIRKADIEALVAVSDREVPVGSRAVSLTVSRERLGRLAGRVLPPQQAERLKNIAAVVDPGHGTIITVLHMQGQRGRRYRR